ncbi:MAG: 7TM-DISM domain-containing protein, partial [Cytophagaceae bacterium]
MHEFPRLKVTIKFALLILSSCFLAGYPIAASEASDIVLTDTADSYVIGDRVFVLYDTTAELSFEKVLQKDGGFVPSKASVPSWGITKSAVWLKIVIKNNSTRP